MKTLLLAGAACVLAAALSGCTTANTAAMQPVMNAIAAEIPYCHVSGSFQAGAGGLAGTGTGVAASNQFDCPAAPRVSAPAADVTAAPAAAAK